jgi:quinol monooxygenase YgiN
LKERTLIKGWIVAALLMSGAAHAAGTQTTSPDAQVLELRQYKIVPGKRDAFVTLFERLFVESQEADGIRLIGHFRDLDDPDRFVWMRSFPDMPAREKSLTAFYFGPVWKAHREEANPMLDDNDNVLLLRPASPDLGFGPASPRPARGTTQKPRGFVLATIEYLWKKPDEGFTALFRDRMKPAIEAAGLPVLAGYVPIDAPNNFPRLPVREERKVFVWITRADSPRALATALDRLHRSPQWRTEIAPQLRRFEERVPQQLRLEPTPRSALH